MHEIIQQVLQAEEEAKRIVGQARAQAEQVIAAAQRDARALTASEKQSAEAEATRIVSLAVEDAQREREGQLARVRNEINERIQIEDRVREEVIESAVRCIAGVRHD